MPPDQRDERGMAVFRQKEHPVAARELSGVDEYHPVIAVEQAAIVKRRRVDHGHASTANRDAHRLCARLIAKLPRDRTGRLQKREVAGVAQQRTPRCRLARWRTQGEYLEPAARVASARF